MVTNALTFVDKADFIVVLEKGCIREYGTLPELISHEGSFRTFLREHLKGKIEKSHIDDSDDDDDGDDDDDDEETDEVIGK